jgi:hypothetical protein
VSLKGVKIYNGKQDTTLVNAKVMVFKMLSSLTYAMILFVRPYTSKKDFVGTINVALEVLGTSKGACMIQCNQKILTIS